MFAIRQGSSHFSRSCINSRPCGCWQYSWCGCQLKLPLHSARPESIQSDFNIFSSKYLRHQNIATLRCFQRYTVDIVGYKIYVLKWWKGLEVWVFVVQGNVAGDKIWMCPDVDVQQCPLTYASSGISPEYIQCALDALASGVVPDLSRCFRHMLTLRRRGRKVLCIVGTLVSTSWMRFATPGQDTKVSKQLPWENVRCFDENLWKPGGFVSWSSFGIR